jgi:hypothetical protein
MKYKTLKQKTPPTPWKDNQYGYLFSGGYPGPLGGMYKSEGAGTSALIVHCVNNFDAALDALRQCRQILDSEYPMTDERHPANWLNETITKLETVNK